jgi:ribosomal protein S14
MDESKDLQESAGETLHPAFGAAKDVMQKYNHCVVCGSHLHFTYVTDFARNLTQESARCPECGVNARRVMHKLQ